MADAYHNQLEKGQTPEIEMPPLPEEPAEQPAAAEAEQPEAPEQEVPQEPESSNAKNIRALREKAERADALERELALMREAFEVSNNKKSEPKNEDFNLAPDDYVEAKHLTKYEQKLKAIEAQLHTTAVEQRVRSEYNDFDKVVNEENLKRLSEDFPSLGKQLKAPGDLYDKAVSAYTLIKNLGVYKEDTYGPDRTRAQANASKPRPLAAVSPQQGDSPLSRANAFANGLTDDLKKQLHQEMLDAIRNS